MSLLRSALPQQLRANPQACIDMVYPIHIPLFSLPSNNIEGWALHPAAASFCTLHILVRAIYVFEQFRRDESKILFGKYLPEIYLVYSWNIHGKGIYLVYTWYTPEKKYLGIPDEVHNSQDAALPPREEILKSNICCFILFDWPQPPRAIVGAAGRGNSLHPPSYPYCFRGRRVMAAGGGRPRPTAPGRAKGDTRTLGPDSEPCLWRGEYLRGHGGGHAQAQSAGSEGSSRLALPTSYLAAARLAGWPGWGRGGGLPGGDPPVLARHAPAQSAAQ
jgi:hypothetical protein